MLLRGVRTGFNFAPAGVLVQGRAREISDEIFLMAMEDFGISEKTRTIIYYAVRDFGRSAWDMNAKLKANGEKRILKTFPQDPTISWSDWKKDASVFAS